MVKEWKKKIVYSVPTKKEKFLCKLREDRCIYLFTSNFVYQQLYRIQIQQASDIESCTSGFPHFNCNICFGQGKEYVEK